jgi:hypothetical protein
MLQQLKLSNVYDHISMVLVGADGKPLSLSPLIERPSAPYLCLQTLGFLGFRETINNDAVVAPASTGQSRRVE